MNDIRTIVDDFIKAAERLERLTGQINAMADQLEPALAGGVPKFAPGGILPEKYEARSEPPVNPTTMPPEGYHFTGSSPTEMAPNTPQGAAPSSAQTTATPPAGAVEVEGPGVGAPETPRPAGPTPEAPPWETQAAAAPAAEEKKGGRRTLEQIAADLGVNLDDVKRWKGAGKRVGKKDMEEFKALAEKAGNSVPAAPSNPFPPAPVTPAAGSVPPQAAPVTEWPTAAPVPPQQAPGEQFGEWPTIEGGFDPSNPFGG